MKKRESFKKAAVRSAGLASLPALAVIVFASMFALFVLGVVPKAGERNSEEKVGVPRLNQEGIKPTNVDLIGRTLVESEFRTDNTGVTSSCPGAGCVTPGASMFGPPAALGVVCPQLAGDTCTLHIQLEAQVNVTVNDNGLFRFLVDGVAPNPGPTDGAGYFLWDILDPNSQVVIFQARSYAVTATVTNDVDFQAHTVDVRIACQDFAPPAGCSASSGFANLRIDVFIP